MRRFLQFTAGLIGIIVLLAIVQYLPAPRHTYFWDATFDTGHILIFGIGVMMSLTMTRAFMGRYRKRWQYFASCILTLALGVLVELWQRTHGRTAEWIDVYNDTIGILAFAALYAIVDSRINEPRSFWLRRGRLLLIASTIVLVGLTPYYRTLHLYHVRQNILPRLIDWEQPWYGVFYYEQSGDLKIVVPPEDWPTSSPERKIAMVTFNREGDYPGFVFREPHPDWSEYEAIELDVLYKGTEKRDFVFRAHDMDHGHEYEDRFSHKFSMHPGFQTIRFRMAEVKKTRSGRQMDLTRIETFSLFTTRLALDEPSSITIFLGSIRLVP